MLAHESIVCKLFDSNTEALIAACKHFASCASARQACWKQVAGKSALCKRCASLSNDALFMAGYDFMPAIHRACVQSLDLIL